METDSLCVEQHHSGEFRRALSEAGITLDDSPSAVFRLAARPGTPPETVITLWSKRSEADVVIAARRSGRGARNRMIRRLLGLPYYDYTSGVRLYRSETLRRCSAEPDRPMTALVRLHRDGYRVREVPLSHRPSVAGAPLMEALGLLRARRAPSSADADERAFVSRFPFRARRLHRRLAHTVSFLEVDVPLLDVGCGSGKLIQSIAKGVGVDVDVSKLRYLRGRAKAPGVAAALTSLPFRDRTFPQVVCTGVWRELDGNPDAIPELTRVLDDRGTLIVGGRDESVLRQPLEASGLSIDDVGRVARDEVVIRAVRRQS